VISASQLERIGHCPASAALPQVRSTSEYAERGNAIHEYLATARSIGRDKALAAVPEAWRPVCEAIDLDALPTMLLSEAAYAYDVDKRSARFLASGKARDYSKALPHELCGTADCVGIDGTTAYVGDFKTGWSAVTPAAKNPQLRFLALCVSLAYPDVETVVVEVIRIREDGSAWRDTATLDALDLAQIGEWVATIPGSVALAKAELEAGRAPDVHEGAWCKYCPAAIYCPAKVGLLRIAANGNDPTAPFMGGPLSPDMAGSAFVLVERLRSIAKELERRVYGALDEFGSLPTPRGTVIKKVLTEGNERIDDDKAVAVLSERGPDVVGACTDLSVTKKSLGAGLRKVYGKDGAKMEREVLAKLRSIGAITRPATERVVEVDGKGAA
jgi:RecB family exonuclease